jgi:aminotransferase EvaB
MVPAIMIVSQLMNPLETVPLNDLCRQTASLQQEIGRAVAQVVTSGWYVLGPNVSAFEREFAQYCDARHCIGVANGTDALELALRALGCGHGSEVITIANAGMYATTAILAIGAIPVLADIEPETLTMSADGLAQRIGAKTAAIIITHLYGQLADFDRLMSIADAHGVPVIEDCAQAHGAERGGRKAGTVGAIGCFSFYPTKNLGALGDGGALTTNEDALADTLKALRQYGWRSKYNADRPYGRNSRLDELQAAVLRVKLPKLDGWNARRREIMKRYRASGGSCVRIPNADGLDHVAHLCVARTDRRERLRGLLTSRKIGTDIHYPIPDHHQAGMRGILPEGLSLPCTEAAAAEILTLPCFPEMTEAEITRVCDALEDFSLEQAG